MDIIQERGSELIKILNAPGKTKKEKGRSILIELTKKDKPQERSKDLLEETEWDNEIEEIKRHSSRWNQKKSVNKILKSWISLMNKIIWHIEPYNMEDGDQEIQYTNERNEELDLETEPHEDKKIEEIQSPVTQSVIYALFSSILSKIESEYEALTFSIENKWVPEYKKRFQKEKMQNIVDLINIYQIQIIEEKIPLNSIDDDEIVRNLSISEHAEYMIGDEYSENNYNPKNSTLLRYIWSSTCSGDSGRRDMISSRTASA